ncbi:hypothetical protein GCM10010284_50040 [Streptomyces rubiginosohelvolus]|nr:hypothetical protein GCM10010284_50040 [Streptomyces rubiginosohelvolus]
MEAAGEAGFRAAADAGTKAVAVAAVARPDAEAGVAVPASAAREARASAVAVAAAQDRRLRRKIVMSATLGGGPDGAHRAAGGDVSDDGWRRVRPEEEKATVPQARRRCGNRCPSLAGTAVSASWKGLDAPFLVVCPWLRGRYQPPLRGPDH